MALGEGARESRAANSNPKTLSMSAITIDLPPLFFSKFWFDL